MTTHDQPDEGKSKTQLKHEAQAVKDMGRRLVDLDAGVLEDLPLPQDLREAVLAARRMHQHGARRRQLQYIAKLMRGMELDEIDAALTRLNSRAREEAAAFARLEDLRERLIDEGDAALEALIALKPDLDRGHVRRLIREARRERETDKPPKAARALFRYLRDH